MKFFSIDIYKSNSCKNKVLTLFGRNNDRGICKAFHFYTRNTPNAMKHANYQIFIKMAFFILPDACGLKT